MKTFLIFAGIFIAIVILLALFLPSPKKVLYEYTRKKFLLTRAEHECYDALVATVGDMYFIFAQVHLPTIVDHKVVGQNWRASFSHISQKSVDFVLCDKKDISPLLAIELDDRSHERPDRIERDHEVARILKEAGVPLYRIKRPDEINRSTLLAQIIPQSAANFQK